MAGVCRRWRDVVMGESNEAHLWRTLYARDFEPFIPSAPSRTYLPPRSARAGDCAPAGRAAAERERYADAVAVDALVCPTWVQLHAHNSGRTVGRLLPSLAPQGVHAAAPLAGLAGASGAARHGAARRGREPGLRNGAFAHFQPARVRGLHVSRGGHGYLRWLDQWVAGQPCPPSPILPACLSLILLPPLCVHKYVSPLLLHSPRPLSQKPH